MHEAQLHTDNSFITLTYSDENLPPNNSLVKSDFQNFMKRLRKSIAPKKVRYYHCGEYGTACKNCEKSKMFCRCGKWDPGLGRAHYHALLFNYDPPDKRLFSECNGNKIFTSEKMRNMWPFGHSVIGEVTFESAAYVARYVMKKVTGEKSQEYYGDRLPEYTTMSRRPGIGQAWYEKFSSDVYPHDRVIVRGHATRPPRYYDNLLQRTDPSTLAQLKIEREKNGKHYVTDVLSDGRVIRVPDSCDARLLVKEVVKRAEIQNLKRPLEDNI